MAASPAEIVERQALLRSIVEAVLALEEPYRSAVILRYYQDLPPREIARRKRAPVETVRSWLRRGIGRLREDVDRRQRGDRAGWAPVLVPLEARGPSEAIGREGKVRTPSPWRNAPMALGTSVGLVTLAGIAWLVSTATFPGVRPAVPQPAGASASFQPAPSGRGTGAHHDPVRPVGAARGGPSPVRPAGPVAAPASGGPLR